MARTYTAAARAHYLVAAALRSGRLVREPCEDCGKPSTPDALSEAHHDDYSRPLDVRWLCSKHHHAQPGHQPHAPEGVTEATCPSCGQTRKLKRQTVRRIERGLSSGLCRNCALPAGARFPTPAEEARILAATGSSRQVALEFGVGYKVVQRIRRSHADRD